MRIIETMIFMFKVFNLDVNQQFTRSIADKMPKLFISTAPFGEIDSMPIDPS